MSDQQPASHELQAQESRRRRAGLLTDTPEAEIRELLEGRGAIPVFVFTAVLGIGGLIVFIVKAIS